MNGYKRYIHVFMSDRSPYFCTDNGLSELTNVIYKIEQENEFVFMHLSRMLFSYTFSFTFSLHVLSVYLNRCRTVMDWFTNQIINPLVNDHLFWATTSWNRQVVAQNRFYCTLCTTPRVRCEGHRINTQKCARSPKVGAEIPSQASCQAVENSTTELPQ